jgi:RNA binding exosome subunit
MSSIRFSLIEGKYICRFTNSQEEDTKSSKETTIVVFLDESGSMGSYGIDAMRKFKEVHLKFMDPQTHVCVIAFQSYSRLVETTLRDLNPNEFGGKGGTNMCPGIPIITQVLQKYQSTDIMMTIMSDGEISDTHSFPSLFEQQCSHFFNSQNISMTLIRLTTNTYGTPAVKELCMFAKMSKEGAGHLITLSPYELRMFDDLFKPRGQSFQVSSSSPNLGNDMFGKYLGSLNLRNGQTFFMENLSELTSEDGSPIEIIEAPITFGARLYEEYLEEIIDRLGQAKVRGDADVDSRIDQLSQLYELLQKQIAVLSKPATGASGATDSQNELSMRVRAKNLLLREKTKEAKTILITLQTLRNKQGVAGMNSKQQADFLQELKDSKNSKDFARRAKTATPDELQGAIQYFISMLPQLKEALRIQEQSGEQIPVDFISQEDSLTAFICAIEAIEEGQSVSVDEAVQLFGLLGLGISHHVDVYPDASMLFGNIQKVFHTCFMNQSTLWGCHGKTQGDGSWGIIKSPFHKGEDISCLTAVVPLKSLNHPLVWECMKKSGILDIQTSITIRRRTEPIPNDVPFLYGALFKHVIGEPRSEANRTLLRDILDTMSGMMASKSWTEIIRMIEEKHVCAFVGDNGFSHYWIPLTFMMCRAEFARIASTNADVLRGMFEFCIFRHFQTLMKGQDRTQTINEFLGISDELKQQVLPDDVPEPALETIVFSREVRPTGKFIGVFNKMLELVYKTCSCIFEFNGISVPTFEQFQQTLAGGSDFDAYQVFSIYVGLVCNGENDRFDKENGGAYKWAIVCSGDVVANIYREDYQKCVKEKDARIQAQKETRFVESVGSITITLFAEGLSMIPPHHSLIPRLIELLCEPSCFEQKSKITLFFLGECGSLTYNQGMIQSKYYKQFIGLAIFDEDETASIKKRMSSWTKINLLKGKANDSSFNNQKNCLSWLQENVGVDPRDGRANFGRLARRDPEKYETLILGYSDSNSDPATLAGFGPLIKAEQARSRLCVEATGFVSLKQYKLSLISQGGVDDWKMFLRDFNSLKSTKPAFYKAYHLEAETYWSQDHKNASLYK